MSWLGDKLRSWGWLPHYTDEDRQEAEMDDALRDVHKGREDLGVQHNRNDEATAALRQTLHRSRLRVAQFATFEEGIRATIKKQRAASEGNQK